MNIQELKVYLATSQGEYGQVRIIEDPGVEGVYGRSGPLKWAVVGDGSRIPGRDVHFFGIAPEEVSLRNSRSNWINYEKRRMEMRGLLEDFLIEVDKFRQERRADIVVITLPVTHQAGHDVEKLSCLAQAGFITPR